MIPLILLRPFTSEVIRLAMLSNTFDFSFWNLAYDLSLGSGGFAKRLVIIWPEVFAQGDVSLTSFTSC